MLIKNLYYKIGKFVDMLDKHAVQATGLWGWPQACTRVGKFMILLVLLTSLAR